VVIFWRGNPSDTTALAQSRDDDWLQSIDSQGNCGYSRLVEVASPKRLLDRDLIRGAPADNPDLKSRPLHDGIEDCFEGKASSIYYLEKGRWLDLLGSD